MVTESEELRMHGVKVLDTPIGNSEIRINDILRTLPQSRIINAFPAPTPGHMIVVIEYSTDNKRVSRSMDNSEWHGGGITKC